MITYLQVVITSVFVLIVCSTLVSAAEFTPIAKPHACVIAKQETLGEWKERFKVTETRDVLVVQGPTMEMSARLDCKLNEIAKWDVGYVQVIRESKLVLSYADTDFVADFEQLPLLDRASENGRPWIGTSKLPLTQDATVYFLDGPHSVAGWQIGGVSPVTGKSTPIRMLDAVQRRSVYDTYLIVMNRETKEYFALQRVRWILDLLMKVDDTKPIGGRSSRQLATVVVLEKENEDVTVPTAALLSGKLANFSASRLRLKKKEN